MFIIKNVPIVIEPGVGALETELLVKHRSAGSRSVPVQMGRVDLTGETLARLPFVPTTRLPHIFSATVNLDTSPALVVYDSFGRIAHLYTRDARRKHWEKYDISEEHAGKAVTQFSVRFNFVTAKDRQNFLTLMEKMTDQVSREEVPDVTDVMAALRTLARSRAAPVTLPIAVEKCKLSEIKI